MRVALTDWFVREPIPGHPDWAGIDTDPAALHWISMAPAREQQPIL